VVMAVFLKVNGIDLMVPETEVVTTMLASFRWLNVRTGVRGLVVPWVKRHRESRTSPLATV
jgi:prophage maintenance system killer protein